MGEEGFKRRQHPQEKKVFIYQDEDQQRVKTHEQPKRENK